MVFSSFSFLFLFLPIVLLLYYIAPNKFKNLVLLLASLFFYAWGEPIYILLMLLSITVNYTAGIIISNYQKQANLTAARLHLIICVIWNLLTITSFKYLPFLVETLNRLLPLKIPTLEISLPIGISFYTFQAMSYVIDVYKDKIKAQSNWLDFALYISMFPQLIAGPIVRYSDIAKEISNRRISLSETSIGSELFITGLAKKVLLANTFGNVFTNIQALSSSHRSVMVLWLGALSYTLQIYFDFSGYSDMAIGLGRMLGFHFNINFNYPYMAKSITDFWRRWHISLSSWFREYVYIPLGGNRNGKVKQIRNILIVWLLTGLWHGAAWNFIFWGLYYGILLLIEKFLLPDYVKDSIIYRFLTIIFIIIGWVLFANSSFKAMTTFLSGMFGLSSLPFIGKSFFYYFKTSFVMLLIGIIGSTNLVKKLKHHFIGEHPLILATTNILLFLLCIAALVYQSYNPFLYFRF